jgi:hypothetical protein
METPFFPVTMAELPGKIKIEELKDTDFQNWETAGALEVFESPGGMRGLSHLHARRLGCLHAR